MSKILDYIKAQHQPKRRRYAHDYLGWCREGRQGIPPMREYYGMSYEAASTVRRNIDGLLKEEAKRQEVSSAAPRRPGQSMGEV